jgi:hypothetical protein
MERNESGAAVAAEFGSLALRATRLRKRIDRIDTAEPRHRFALQHRFRAYAADIRHPGLLHSHIVRNGSRVGGISAAPAGGLSSRPRAQACWRSAASQKCIHSAISIKTISVDRPAVAQSNLAPEAIDHPPIPADDRGVFARVISLRRQLPALLPEQPVNLDQRKPAAAHKMARKR